jgi:hypothetical protein
VCLRKSVSKLPPTILSANQKSSEVKVKIRPLDFPEFPRQSNGGAATGANAVSSTQSETESVAQTQAATTSETAEEDNNTQQSNKDDNVPQKDIAQPALSETAAETGDASNSDDPTHKADPTLALTDNTEKLAVNDNDEATESLSSDTSENEEEDPAQPSDKGKDDMREDNIRVKRTKLSPPRTLEMTLFDRLEKMYGAGIKRLLAAQYR